MQIKSLQAEIKTVSRSQHPNGEFEAILSTKALDRDGEMILPRAFDPLPKSLPIYHCHDWMAKALPIGRAEPYYKGDELRARGFFASTPKAQEVRTLVNEGIVTAMSVGFLDAKKKPLPGGRTAVVKGELIEASFTAIPVNTTAAVLASKSLRSEQEEELRLRARALALKALALEIEGLADDLNERERSEHIDRILASARRDRERIQWACWQR